LSRSLGDRDGLTVVGLFQLGGWDHADLAVKASVVEPVDVFQGGELDVIEPSPWAFRSDQLGLIEPVETLSQSIVIGITSGPDRGHHAGLGQAFGVPNRKILNPAVAVMDSPPRS
jgi:hypothetical protein